MEVFKNIATVVGCVSACIALLVTIIKPIRQWLIESLSHRSQQVKISKKIDEMSEKIDQLLTQNKSLDSRLTRVEKNVLENEADRIKSELFDCGNRCRRGIRLHPEEMDHIRTIYHKYKEVLHQNHDGETEFDFITEYYNTQTFPAYHTQCNNLKEE